MAASKKKVIKLRYGGLRILAGVTGVSEQTIRRAMKFENDTLRAEQIRRKAFEMNLVAISNKVKI